MTYTCNECKSVLTASTAWITVKDGLVWCMPGGKCASISYGGIRAPGYVRREDIVTLYLRVNDPLDPCRPGYDEGRYCGNSVCILPHHVTPRR